MQLLRARRECAELFSSGDYQPLHANGKHSNYVIAFVRRFQDQFVVVVVPRLPHQLTISMRTSQSDGSSMCLSDLQGDLWEDTTVELNDDVPLRFREHFRGRSFNAADSQLRLADLFSELPFAVLTTSIVSNDIL